ncbi:MAG: TRAP transporter substrate-binding protein [Deferrisomatales bacterium]|nr:TRAP transporter substrate-binding protein [Deferrisomatales bacterium]
MRKKLKALGSICLVLAVVGLPLLAQAETIKIGSIAPPKNGHTLSLMKIADEVREQTGGRLDIQVFPLGQLGNERSMCSQVQAGTLQMVSSTTSVMENFVPEIAVIDLPFMFPDIETAHAVLDDPEVLAKLFSYFEKKGLVGLSFCEDSLRQWWNTKKAIRTPEDFKGLKIRTMNSPMMLETFKAFGASPVGIPFPEVYSALQTGVVDGVNASYVASTMMKFPEVAKYLTVSEFHMNAPVNTANIDWWNSLSADDQKLLRGAFAKATQLNRAMNDKVAAHLPPDGKKSVADYLKDQNVQIVTLTSEEREAFKKAAAPVWEKARTKIGGEIIDFMVAKVKEHQKK